LIKERAPRTVADLSGDLMFEDNPLVTRGLVRSYAGAPLISYRGEVLGGLCGLDIRPRAFGPRETAYLQRMAVQVVERIEARAAAG
jgi:GAF domain-containing protein